MKRISIGIFLILCLSLIGTGQVTKEFRKKVKAKLEPGAWIEKVDQFDGYLMVTSKAMEFCPESNIYWHFKVRVNENGDVDKSYVKIRYKASSWMFMDKMDLNYEDLDGKLHRFSMPLSKGRRDVLSGGTIAEVSYPDVSQEFREFLVAWTNNSKKVINIKLSGEKTYRTCQSDIFKKPKHRELIRNWFRTVDNLGTKVE